MAVAKRWKLLACEIFYRECLALMEETDAPVEVMFLPKGLHDVGKEKMSAELAVALREAEADVSCEAVLLAYGLCNYGIGGLTPQRVPLVIPRAHDCLTLFFGSRRRYEEYFFNHPGTYFQTVGWLERADLAKPFVPDSFQARCGLNQTYEEFVQQYGEENGRYLWETLTAMTRHYNHLAFLETNPETDTVFSRQAEDLAQSQHWTFEKLPGDLTLLRDLILGHWDDERFLIVPPGKTVTPTYDETLITIDHVH
ncbi:MAG: DUF1638 domain-containing protein [Planctomycetia bacterium]|nr:DUF1638 domain-containing protein [Planctomycetia bacterium]